MKHVIVVIVCIAIIALVGIYVYYEKVTPSPEDQEKIAAMRMEKVRGSKVLSHEEALRLMDKVKTK